MHDEEIISILLNEYNTLRGEIVARAGHGFQIIGFSVAAYAFLANRAGLNVSFWIGVGLITVVAAFGTWFTIRDTRKAHDRLAEIELYINDLIGEDILVWENLWSSGARGVLGFAKPALRCELQGRKPPERTRGGRPLGQDSD